MANTAVLLGAVNIPKQILTEQQKTSSKLLSQQRRDERKCALLNKNFGPTVNESK